MNVSLIVMYKSMPVHLYYLIMFLGCIAYNAAVKWPLARQWNYHFKSFLKNENFSDSDILYQTLTLILWLFWMCISDVLCMCVLAVIGDAVLCKSCEWDGPTASRGSSLWLSASRYCSSQSQFLSVPSHIRCQFSLSVLWIRSSQSSHYRYECRRQVARPVIV